MATGIANAIIYVRGVDLLSKPIQIAARKAMQEVNKIRKTNDKLDSDITADKNKLASAQQKLANITVSYQQKQKDFANKINIQKTKQLELSQKIVDLGRKQAKIEDAQAKFIKKRNDLEAKAVAASAVGKSTAAFSAQIDKVNKKIIPLSIQWSKVETAINAANRSLDTTKKTTELLGKQRLISKDLGLQGINSEINKITQLTAGIAEKTELRLRGSIEIDAAKAAATILGFQAKLQALQSRIATLGLTATAIFSAVGIGLGKVTVTAFADYEKSLRNIQSIGQQTDEEMNRLSSTFLKFSSNIGKTLSTPKQLAESFYEIQSAGFYGADAMRVLESATKTATAGLADQVSTAKALAMALHAYGVGTEEATHYTDVMMRAVDIGIFRFEDLTTQMGDFIAAAGMMGVPIEEVMAALTAMTKKGLPIAEAATSLNRIMMNYLKPAKKEIDLAKEYGIELSVNTLRTKGFAGAMTELMEKTKGNEDVLANLIGEVRGIRGVFALGSDGLKMYNEDLERLYASAGTVDRVFKTQTRSLSAQFQNLKNQLSVLAIGFGQTLSPAVSGAISWLSKITNTLDNLSQSSKLAIANIAGVALAIGPLMLASSGLISAISLVISIFKFFDATATASMINFVTKTWKAITAVNILGVTLGKLVIGISIFAAFAAAVYLVVKAIKAWKEAQIEAERQKHLEYIKATTDAFANAQSAIDNYSSSLNIYKDALENAQKSGDYTQIQGFAKSAEKARKEALLWGEALRKTNIEQLSYEYNVLSKRLGQLQKGFDLSGITKQQLLNPQQLINDFPDFEDQINEFIKLKEQIARAEAELSRIYQSDALTYLKNDVVGTKEGIVGMNAEVSRAKYLLGEIERGEYFASMSSGIIRVSNLLKTAFSKGLELKFETKTKYEKEAEDIIAKYKEMKKGEDNLEGFGISEFTLQSNIAGLDAYIQKLKEATGPLNLTYLGLLAVRNEISKDYNNALDKVFIAISSKDWGSALTEIKNGWIGADASMEDFIAQINTMPPDIQNLILNVIGLERAVIDLRDQSADTIEFRVKLLTEGFDQIESIYSSLVGIKTIPEILKLQNDAKNILQSEIAKIKATPHITEDEASLRIAELIKNFQNGVDKIVDDWNDIKKAGTGAASAIDDKFSTVIGKIQGYLSSGMGFSKGLGNLLPGGENGPLAPGGNGGFEALYRIQDIAMSKTRGAGVDTQKWMDMYGLNPDQAAEIVKKFQMGIFDADVMKYVDTEALINTAKLEMIAEASQKALAEKLGKESGLGKEVFMGLFGMNTKDEKGNTLLPTIDVGAIRTQISDNTAKLPVDASIMKDLIGAKQETIDTVIGDSLGLFITQFDAGKEKKKAELEGKGALLWGAVGDGIVKAAENDGRFYTAVEKMVLKALGE